MKTPVTRMVCDFSVSGLPNILQRLGFLPHLNHAWKVVLDAFSEGFPLGSVWLWLFLGMLLVQMLM